MYPRETQEYSLQRLDSSRSETDEDISRFFVETNVFAIDELYNNNIPPDVSMICDEVIATTDSKVQVEDKKIENRPCGTSSARMDKAATSIKPCRGSAASTGSASKQLAMPKPVKDIVLVRSRRGQATDRHSVAERVRREKIRKRMNYLKDLVPGCWKGAAKTVILDQIINYIKSLQYQVEFLSMKLSAAAPRYNFSLEPGNHDLRFPLGSAETDAQPQSFVQHEGNH